MRVAREAAGAPWPDAIERLYRIRGHRRASKALIRLTDAMAYSPLPGDPTLRATLLRWRREVLAYFLCRLTNARVEGFNGKAKLVLRRTFPQMQKSGPCGVRSSTWWAIQDLNLKPTD